MPATDIVGHFFDGIAESLSVEAARKIIALRLDPAIQSRLDELAQKANQGTLSVAECEEYEMAVEELDLVAILKLKLRAAERRTAKETRKSPDRPRWFASARQFPRLLARREIAPRWGLRFIGAR